MSERLRHAMLDAADAVRTADAAHQTTEPDVLHPLARSRVETYHDPYTAVPDGDPSPGTVMPPTTSPTPTIPRPGDREGLALCRTHRRAVHRTVAALTQAGVSWPVPPPPCDPVHATLADMSAAAGWAAACCEMIGRLHHQLDGDAHTAARRALYRAAGQARHCQAVWDRIPRDVTHRGATAIRDHRDRSGTTVTPPAQWPPATQPRCSDCGYGLVKARGWCANCYERRRSNGWRRAS